MVKNRMLNKGSWDNVDIFMVKKRKKNMDFLSFSFLNKLQLILRCKKQLNKP